MNLDEYDSSGVLDDSGELRARFAEMGFLLFRGLLDRRQIGQVRGQVLERLYRIGWLRAGSDPEAAIPGDRVHHDRGILNGRPVRDPDWPTGYRAVQSLESLHRLAHCPPLLETLRDLFDGEVVVHPRKIARIAFPGLLFPTPPHQDALFNRAAGDVVTAWVPLGDYSEESGCLQVLYGSAGWGALPTRASEGLGGETVEVRVDDPRWVSGGFCRGDVILFHSRTIHMVPANRSAALRLSVDFRYQSPWEPLTPAMLSPHGYAAGNLPGWGELTEGWSSVRWVEVDRPISVVAVPPATLPPSRLVPQSRVG